ncbi:MAG: MBOAT family O-acyltransferase [Myxococcota bacterium]|nr:MBOAT family O-acyltransferase [Myxococcota bacterium]
MALVSELKDLLAKVAAGEMSLADFDRERSRVLDAHWDHPTEVEDEAERAVTERVSLTDLPSLASSTGEQPPSTHTDEAEPPQAIRVVIDSPEDTGEWVRTTEAAPAAPVVPDEPSAPSAPALRWASTSVPTVPALEAAARPWTWGAGGLAFLPGLLLLAMGLFGLLQPVPDGAGSGSIQFESSRYVLFFLGCISIYWLLAPSRTAQKLFLVGVSAAFYATYSPTFVLLLGVAIVGNWLCGEGIAEALSTSPRRAKRWMWAGVAANLTLLGVFKYYGFFIETLGDVFELLGFSAHLPLIQIILPVGISYYTFQSIAYLVELHRGTGHRAKSLLDFSLFLGFFPQLLIGPICRGRELLPQIEAPSPQRVEQTSRAMSLILSGLFKRMILGSLLFSFGVPEIFYTPEKFSALALWVAMVGYTVQIWCDFSGYTDIVRGCALLMGFEIPDNFNGPYVARSVGEFWRRWHITFSHWLRDFIYFPLGGSHCPRHRAYLNLFTTMLVCGIWHGAKWGFLVWGVIHGIALVMYKFGLDRARDRGIDPKAPKPPLIQLRGWLWTMGVVCFSRIFFVTSDLESALLYIQRMFNPSLPGLGFEAILIPITLAGLGLNFVGTGIRTRFIGFSEGLGLAPRFAFWLLCFIVLTSFRPLGVLPNAYFQF